MEMNYNFEENKGILRRTLLPDVSTIMTPTVNLLFRPNNMDEVDWIAHWKRVNLFTSEHSVFYDSYWKTLPEGKNGNAKQFVQWMIEVYPNVVGSWVLERGYLDSDENS